MGLPFFGGLGTFRMVSTSSRTTLFFLQVQSQMIKRFSGLTQLKGLLKIFLNEKRSTEGSTQL